MTETAEQFYFCLGIDRQSEVGMNNCIADNKEQVCISNTEQKRVSGFSGKWGPNEGPGKCGEVFWMCDKVQHTSEAEYNKSSCFGSEGGGDKVPLNEQCLLKTTPPVHFDIREWCRGFKGLWDDFSLCTSSGFYKCMGYE